MNEILKNKKLVIIGVIAFLTIAICFAFMTQKSKNESNFLNVESENSAEISESTKSNDVKNSEDDGFIYIHILGEVKNQGFLRLPEREQSN